MNQLKSPSRAKKSVANPCDKRSNNRGKFETARTSSQTKLKRVPNFFGVVDKIDYTKTPSPKSERVVPGRVGVVTNTSVHLNESKKSTTQLSIVQLTNIKHKLEFPNKNPIDTRKNGLASKSSMKSSKKQSKKPKLKLHEIDWTDPEQLRNKVGKYETNNTRLLTQETMIPFLLNQLTAASIKMAFLMLIGQNGDEAKVFLPIPATKPKLVEGFLVMIYNMKTMMVDNKKQVYR
jgi:hypothetical protein